MVHITHDRRERLDGRFEREVRWVLSHAFTNAEFFTLAETAKYKPSESLDTYRQMVEERPEIVEIYHRGEWLCDVASAMTKDQIVSKVWKNLELKKERQQKESAGKKESEKNAVQNNTTAK